MLTTKQALIREEVSAGTGADIELAVDTSGHQTGLRIWFADLERTRSPIVDLRPSGLNRYEARLTFGHFAGPTLAQMMQADDEEVQLARALVSTVARTANVTLTDGQDLADWKITESGFGIRAERRGLQDRFGDETLISTCRDLVIPILAAMAELYGYDPVEESSFPDLEAGLEGSVRLAVVRRRERNPRNRLLCLRIHGQACSVCGLDPKSRYGAAGSIIEVHHLQPLAASGKPRAYNPETDLVPLCPSCHRAVHTRRPSPWSPQELKAILTSDD